MDMLFFIASKLVWMLIRPESWIILALVITLVALWRDAKTWAVGATLANLGFLLILGNWNIWVLLLHPLENRHPIAPSINEVDGIIVLGGAELALPTAVWGAPQFDDEAERFTEAVALANRFPDARVIFTGGTNAVMDLGQVSTGQSDVARMFFEQQGIAAERIVLESASRNTIENAEYTYDLIQPAPDQTWVLVTSAFHMPRSVKTFDRAGWQNVTPWPTDFRSTALSARPRWDLARNLDQLNVAVREYIGLLAYDIAGK